MEAKGTKRKVRTRRLRKDAIQKVLVVLTALQVRDAEFYNAKSKKTAASFEVS